MKFLFIHPVYPGQFQQLMLELAKDPQHEVIHLYQTMGTDDQSRVKKIQLTPKKSTDIKQLPHVFSGNFIDGLWQADAAAAAALELKKSGWIPDVIYSYTGQGHLWYLKDIFPDAILFGFFEWYKNLYGADINFNPEQPLGFDHQRYLKIFNANILLDLENCDVGITPTAWQKQQFPKAYQSKLHIFHEGINTDFFTPKDNHLLHITALNKTIDVSKTPVVAYCTRGMEPYRGFPQFMRAIAKLQKKNKDFVTIIAGTEAVFYSKNLPNNQSYKALMLEELKSELDLSRIIFTGFLSTADYVEILQKASVQVYLTYPFVLSWSLLEAMSAGALLVASDTAPVREVLQHEHNALLVDFFNDEQLAITLADILEKPQSWQALRTQARADAMAQFQQKIQTDKIKNFILNFTQAKNNS